MWRALAESPSAGHRHQCAWWMEPLEQYGVRSYAVGCWDGDRLVGGAQFRSYRVPLTRRTLSECLDGPIFLHWEEAWADAFVAGLVEMAGTVNSIAVIIRDCPRSDVHRDLLAAFQRSGLTTEVSRASPDAVVALKGRTLDQIRSGFNHGTRQRIRKGLAGQLTVRRLTSDQDLVKAYEAWIATANRKSFTDVRPWTGLAPVLRYCIDNRHGSVLGSFLDDRLLAAVFVVHIGRATAWVYGGYVDGAQKQSATQVLQFEAIRESLERGMEAYNFGNLIAEGQPAAQGVDDFKLGFGAVPQQHLDTIVWKRNPRLYSLVGRLRQGWIGRRLEALFKMKLIGRRDSNG